MARKSHLKGDPTSGEIARPKSLFHATFAPNPVQHPVAFDRFVATVKGSTLECRILLSRRDLPGALGASPAASVLEGDAVLAQAAPKLQHRLPGRTWVEVVPLTLGEIGRLRFTSEGIGPIPIIVRGQSRLVTRRLPLEARTWPTTKFNSPAAPGISPDSRSVRPRKNARMPAQLRGRTAARPDRWPVCRRCPACPSATLSPEWERSDVRRSRGVPRFARGR